MLENATTFSGYSVDDITAARQFYEGTLGCEIVSTDMGLDLRLPGGQRIFLYDKADDHAPATFTVLNFKVPSINQTIDQLTAAGIVMERYDSLPAQQDERAVLRGKAAHMGPDIAWFKDPAGNVLSVIED